MHQKFGHRGLSESENSVDTTGIPIANTRINLLVLLLCAVFLNACATTKVNTSAEVDAPDSAILKPSFHRESAYRWTAFSLYSANGVRIPMGLFSPPSSTKVPAGKANLVVHASFNLGSGTASEAKIPVEAELKPGVIYEINGDVSGSSVEAWLVDASSGEKISSSFSNAATPILQAPSLIRFTLPKK